MRGSLKLWLGPALCIVVLLSGAPAALAQPPAAASATLDAFARRAMDTFATPGMAVVVVDASGIHTHAWGVRKLGDAAPVGPHTIFPIGSNTKAFTAAALAILVDQGKLRWDDRVVDKLPGFRMYDAYASSEMTITDLLVHRSGLGLGQGDLMFVPTTNRTCAELVHAIRYLQPVHSFRSGYAYDNVLYTVAGELVRSVSGERWEDFVQQHLLDPLGMRDTQVSIDARVPDQAALHGKIDTPVRGVGAPSVLPTLMGGDTFAPAGALQASAADMGRWLQAQLGRGAMPDGQRIFSADAAQALWTPQTLIPIGPAPAAIALAAPQFSAYALGLEVTDYRGHKIVTHLGGVLGAISAVVIIPERQVAFAIVLNSEDAGTLFAMREHLLDMALGLDSPDWIAAYQQVLAARYAKATQALRAATQPARTAAGPSLPLLAYAGVYRDPWYGTVTISAPANGKAGGLRIRFDRSPGMEGALEHTQYDSFRTRFRTPGLEDAYVTFALTPQGAIERVTMQAVSPLADFSYDYQDLRFTPVAAPTAGAR